MPNRIGFSLLVALPPTMESSPFSDGENQTVFVFPKGQSAPEARLIIARGPEEEVEAGDSLDSTWMKERWVKNTAGQVIGIEARGVMIRGGYWRRVSLRDHEAISYSLQAGEEPGVLDQVIDSGCLKRNLEHSNP
ncbi:MAG TPA: hypothetical protein VJP87_10950 [Candidatus Acidoferrales bacterium]|nr:hypothetical protein [Candidatus Acidoferrales bacterium]